MRAWSHPASAANLPRCRRPIYRYRATVTSPLTEIKMVPGPHELGRVLRCSTKPKDVRNPPQEIFYQSNSTCLRARGECTFLSETRHGEPPRLKAGN